jgi:hypothetical protein
VSFAGDGPRTHVYSVLKTKTSLGALFALLLGLTPLTALARETEGTIVSVQLTDVLVDLGTTSGVETGDILDVWRPIVVKHPVTKQVIHDRFRIARLRVVQARPALSITRLEGETEHPLAAGDVVVATNGLSGALSATTLPAPPPPALPTPSAATTTTTTTSAESMSTDGRELDALFTSLRGAPPARRIAAYERWVAEHPKNRHVQVVTDEAIVLRRLGEAKKATSDPDPDPALARRLDEPHTRAYRPVRVARANEPLRIAIELAKTRGAVFNVRREGEAGFTTSPMTDMGKGYFGITLLPGTMRPDNLEYFIEAIDPSGGKAVAVSGSAASPLAISVEDVVPLDTHREPLLVTASVPTMPRSTPRRATTTSGRARRCSGFASATSDCAPCARGSALTAAKAAPSKTSTH